MAIIIGSARVDERGRFSGGTPGDQKGNEVALENFYRHSQGWLVLRPLPSIADKMADGMEIACANNNIGYSQSGRLSIFSSGGVTAQVKCNCDCSSLVRACYIYATGKDCGNFNTASQKTVLMRTGMFTNLGTYNAKTILKRGDVLVTLTQGHTVIVTDDGSVSGNIYYTVNNNGIENKNGEVAGSKNDPLLKIAIRTDVGTVTYKAHIIANGKKRAKWLPEVTGYDWNDHANGYAGDGVTPIDAIMIKTSKGSAIYCVSPCNSDAFYEEVKNYSDYAGVFKKPIDQIKIRLG